MFFTPNETPKPQTRHINVCLIGAKGTDSIDGNRIVVPCNKIGAVIAYSFTKGGQSKSSAEIQQHLSVEQNANATFDTKALLEIGNENFEISIDRYRSGLWFNQLQSSNVIVFYYEETMSNSMDIRLLIDKMKRSGVLENKQIYLMGLNQAYRDPADFKASQRDYAREQRFEFMDTYGLDELPQIRLAFRSIVIDAFSKFNQMFFSRLPITCMDAFTKAFNQQYSPATLARNNVLLLTQSNTSGSTPSTLSSFDPGLGCSSSPGSQQ